MQGDLTDLTLYLLFSDHLSPGKTYQSLSVKKEIYLWMAHATRSSLLVGAFFFFLVGKGGGVDLMLQ